MTLQQYLNQDPVVKRLQGSVLLEPTDFQYWTVFQNKKWEFCIHIYAFATSTYRLDDEGVLWTMDDQGHFKSRSVFYIDRKKHLDT